MFKHNKIIEQLERKDKETKELKKILFNFWNSSKQYYIFSKSLNLNFYDKEHHFHKEIISLIKKDTFVLDLACGSAEINREIRLKGSHYMGIDISGIALSMSRGEKGVSLIKGDVSRIPFKDNIFDIVFSTYSLEHFLSPGITLMEAKRVLKKSGLLILLSEAYDNPFTCPPSLDFGLNNSFTFKKHISMLRFNKVIQYFLRRLWYCLSQIIKQLRLYLFRTYFQFDIIKNPNIIKESFAQDKDVVYIVSIREIINFLRFLNMNIERANYNNNSRHSFTKYFVKPLFIIARKK